MSPMNRLGCSRTRKSHDCLRSKDMSCVRFRGVFTFHLLFHSMGINSFFQSGLPVSILSPWITVFLALTEFKEKKTMKFPANSEIIKGILDYPFICSLWSIIMLPVQYWLFIDALHSMFNKLHVSNIKARMQLEAI